MSTPIAIPPSVESLAFLSPLSVLEGGADMFALFVRVKHCKRCDSFKPADEFGPDKRTRCGLTAYCRKCDLERRAGYKPPSGSTWRKAYWARCRDYGIAPVTELFDRDDLVARDGELCAECGAEGVPLELDHVIPVAAGGPHTLANVRLVDAACNRRKGATSDRALVDEFNAAMEASA